MDTRNKYRIVTDTFSGYEAQFRFWWLPFFWMQCFTSNTSGTLEKATEIANNHAAGMSRKGRPKDGTVVSILGKLPPR